MKVEHYNAIVRAGLTRRRLLQSAAAAGGVAAMGGLPGAAAAEGMSADEAALRAQILQIPGVGMGSPTDADWRKVGELTLGSTKATVEQGEFAGVELSFMGLNNQNLHNFLFRGFLAPWEEYTGAKINWIDLAQADFNARLQQSIATGTVDFDMLEMGAPFEGDTAGRGLLDEMPEWVAEILDLDDLVGYLKPPVGTWDGKTYRVSIDGDCHTLSYRKDYFTDPTISAATGYSEVPDTYEAMDDWTVKMKGQTDPLTGLPAYGFLDPLKYQWGGFGFYFLADRAAPYMKVQGNAAWIFDPDTMKPLVNSPGWVQAIDDVFNLIKADAYPPDQVNADPNATAFAQFLAGTGGAVMWWGDVGSNARTSDTSVVGDVTGFGINPGATKLYDWTKAEWVEPEGGKNEAPYMAYLGWGIYVTSRVSGDEKKRKAAWSAAAHLGGKDLALWMSAYPSGFQPYRNSQFDYDEWAAAGYDRDYIADYLGSNLDSYNHPNAAVEPRIPGIFQYFSILEDEMAKGVAGQYASAQETADAIAAAWEEITDQIGRDSQIALYKASLGL